MSPKGKAWIDKTWNNLEDESKLLALVLWMLYVLDPSYLEDVPSKKIKILGGK